VHSSSTMANRHTARYSDDLTCALDDLRRVADLTGGTDVLFLARPAFGVRSAMTIVFDRCHIQNDVRTCGRTQ